jgi:hypothetical protein
MPCRHIARTSIGRADHFWGAEDFEGTDDEEAIRKVQQTMDGRDTEVWERGRFVVRLSSHPIRNWAPGGNLIACLATLLLRRSISLA